MSEKVLAVDLVERQQEVENSGDQSWSAQLVDDLLEEKIGKEETEENEDSSSEETTSLESLHYTISLEAEPLTDDAIYENVKDGVATVAKGAYNLAKKGAKTLYNNREEIKSGITTVGKLAIKGGSKALFGLIRAIDKGSELIDELTEKEKKEIQTLVEKIDSQLKLITTLPDTQIQAIFDDAKILSKILPNTGSLMQGTKTLERFVQNTSIGLINTAHHSINGVTRSIKQVESTHAFNKLHLTDQIKLTQGFSECEGNASSNVMSICYKDSLPGSVNFTFTLPSEQIETFDQYLDAVNHSNVEITNSETRVNTKGINYFNKTNLIKYLNELKDILQMLDKNRLRLSELSKERSKLKMSLSGYVKFLANDNTKADYNKFSAYIAAKGKTIDKVYINGVVKVNNYTIDLIRDLLLFTDSNIKAFKE